jgi:hypothetical protein
VRRVALAALAGAALAGGCGSPATHSNPKKPPPGSIEALLGRPGQDVALVAGTSHYVPGTIRVSFLVVRHDASVVTTPAARVWIATALRARPYEKTLARLEPIGVPGRSEAALGGALSLYVTHLDVPRPGNYYVLAEPIAAKRPTQALGNVIVSPRSSEPAVGAKAIASKTPTLASTHGDLAKLTTAQPPDGALLRYSVAASLAAHKPFVLVFATPKFCESRTCGPVVDVAEAVRRRFAATDIRFIHVEIYRDNDPAKGFNRWFRQWRLPSEPWTFLVGRDGRIKAKFEGSVSVGELAAAVRQKLLRG